MDRDDGDGKLVTREPTTICAGWDAQERAGACTRACDKRLPTLRPSGRCRRHGRNNLRGPGGSERCLRALLYPLLGDRNAIMTETALHQSHPETVKRLRRAEGHLRGVIEMI